MKQITFFILSLFLFIGQLFAQLDTNDFVTTWKTNPGTANNKWILIRTDFQNYTHNYSVDLDNDGVMDTTNINGDFFYTFDDTGTYTIRIRGDFTSPDFDSDQLLSLDQWGNQAWKNLEYSFDRCPNLRYNASDQPNLDSINSLAGMFYQTPNLGSPNLNHWDLSGISDLRFMFSESNFNGAIDQWDVSNVTNMGGLFAFDSLFNQPIGNWDVSSLSYMGEIFRAAKAFNQPIGNWDVSNVTQFFGAFSEATNFNQPLNNWNLSQALGLQFIFQKATSFNQNLDNWDVSKVDNFAFAFDQASAFDQNLNNWDVSSARRMDGMFANASQFNSPLDQWDMDSVERISLMFYHASSFNQDLRNWDVYSVSHMNGVFAHASSYSYPLNGWDINQVQVMDSMLNFSGLSTSGYDSTLIDWELNPRQSNVTLGAQSLTYCAADSSRIRMFLNGGWNFIGDSRVTNCITSNLQATEVKKASLSVYPNPAKDQIFLKATESIDRLQLLSLNGKIILESNPLNEKARLDLTKLNDGVYLLKIVSAGKLQQRKIIVD